MPSNRKIVIKDTVQFITTSVQEGLPLVSSEVLKVALESVLASALKRYDVTLCHGVLMANHMHLLIVSDEPTHVDMFMCYIKRESAYRVNKLLGIEKKKVWEDGYDSPIILDAKKAIEKIVYIYTNPQRANLVDRIEDYPNLNTWEVFKRNRRTPIVTRRIRRFMVPTLGKSGALSIQHMNELSRDMLYKAKEKLKARLDPNKWMNCFGETKYRNREEINEEILKNIREIEKELREERKVEVIGSKTLRTSSMKKEYKTKRKGKKSICISSYKTRRIKFLTFYKKLVEKAKDLYRRFGDGEGNLENLPEGLFAPGGMVAKSIKAHMAPVYSPG